MQTVEDFMKRAIQLADLGKGYVAPNPLVGCVIVSKDGRVVGEGYHERYGHAHAEVNAVASVRDKSDLVDATVYVTLEPCSHTGKTPPCAPMLAQLPIQKVCIGLSDPNPLVNGNGIRILQEAGIEVDTGILEQEIKHQNRFFLHFIQYQKPYITLKIAQTLDGYVAASDGSSQWISGKAARTLVHSWRSEYDAVMVGRSTVELDNPSLTVRHVEGRQPQRIVLDGPGTCSLQAQVFSDQFEDKTTVVTFTPEKYLSKDPMLSLLGGGLGFKGKVVQVSSKNGHVDLDETVKKLGEHGFSSILVEAGSALASAMIRENVVDQIEVFIAPKLLGDGKRAFKGLGIARIQDALTIHRSSVKMIGNDILMTGYL